MWPSRTDTTTLWACCCQRERTPTFECTFQTTRLRDKTTMITCSQVGRWSNFEAFPVQVCSLGWLYAKAAKKGFSVQKKKAFVGFGFRVFQCRENKPFYIALIGWGLRFCHARLLLLIDAIVGLREWVAFPSFNAFDRSVGSTALVEACRNRDLGMLDLLLRNYARDDECKALFIAAQNKEELVVSKLLALKVKELKLKRESFWTDLGGRNVCLSWSWVWASRVVLLRIESSGVDRIKMCDWVAWGAFVKTGKD